MCVLRAEEDYPSLGVNPRSRQAREAFPRTEKHGMAFLFLNFAGTYASSKLWKSTCLTNHDAL